MIDIVVGGQFGDEGKGSVAAHLADKMSYGFAVRVGGSNAEHRFRDRKDNTYTSRVIPTAAWIDPHVKLVLGAGHIIKMHSLFREMQELDEMFGDGHTEERLYIDTRAGVIESKHIEISKDTAWRGSTHQGVGAAAAHKVTRDGEFKMAKDYPELKNMIAETPLLMNAWLKGSTRETGLLEGNQGVLLSLNHGYYPYCTSKDVTPAALLAEAGIATPWTRDIYAVYRTVPMRVPGNSGPTGNVEMSWEYLERALRRKIPEKMKLQTDSGDYERIFRWSWADFDLSIALCRPTKLVVTFLDWWPYKFDKEEWLNTMEEVSGSKIVLKRYGPEWGDHCWS